MKSIKITLSILAIATIALSSCKKEQKDDFNSNKKGAIELHFDNRAGSADLVLNTTAYKNSFNEDMTFTRFDYYISNIKLIKEDGSIYTVPRDNSYFLVKENDAASQEIKLTGVPENNYTGVTFTIGVDSLKNVAPLAERTGVLDPSGAGADMYWAWNSGYIFVKMEGTSPSARLDSVSGIRPFKYHIGLFGGYSTPTVNNIKEVTILFGGDKAAVREAKSKVPQAHINVDALKVVNGPNNISVATTPVIMVTPISANVAENYKSMFTLDHLHGE